MVVTVIVGLALFWLELWQLWREARPSALLLRTTQGLGYIPAPAEGPAPEAAQSERDVIVITERPPAG